ARARVRAWSGARSPATRTTAWESTETMTAPTKKASGSRKAAAPPRSRQGADSLRASERVELDLDEVAIRRLRIDLGKRGLIRGSRFVMLAGRKQNIAAKIGVNAGKGFVGLGVEHPQRVVVLLVV